MLSDSLRNWHSRFCFDALPLALCCFPFLFASLSPAQDHDVLCREGSGSFQAEFHTGVTVKVMAARTGELATRACEATLSWDKNTLMVAANAPQLDLDTFGVDLGLGVPIAAFQVKKSANDCCMKYQIYSLEKPPRLLRTLTGGDFFSAADTDLDGRVEIWTRDAAAMDGFENLSLGELDSAPTIVLRFAYGELLDVSSEFQPDFDREIAELRKELDSDDLRGFKSSDGKLSPSLSAERLHELRGVKAKILEMIWAYLYSGREQKAWEVLAEMWPAADLSRIRAAILNARAHGIRAQVNGMSKAASGTRKKRARIFDAVAESASGKLEVAPPEPIMLRRPPPVTSDKDLPQSELLLELVVDAAGKVRTVEPAGKAKSADANLIYTASGWKFIPAFKAGQAVASRMRLAISLRQ
jgi:hypothetical protein